jgi:hypothetical protein
VAVVGDNPFYYGSQAQNSLQSHFEERIKELQGGLFSQALSYQDQKGKMEAFFDYTEKNLFDLVTFMNFENSCCGDFEVNLLIKMKEKLIKTVSND